MRSDLLGQSFHRTTLFHISRSDTMSSTSESSGSEYENELDETCMDGSNAFAFEPEYPENEVQQRLMHHFSQAESDTIDFVIHGDEESASEDDGNGCTCENCAEMHNDIEQVCCQANSAMIGNKIGTEKCIAQTSAFRDVCLNVNVLEAALGTWRTFTDDSLNISATNPIDSSRTANTYHGYMVG